MATPFMLQVHTSYAQVVSPEFVPPNLHQSKIENLTLESISARYGIFARHKYSSSKISSIKETISASACVLDVNNDGFQDLLTLSGGGFQREFGRPAWWAKPSTYTLHLNVQGRYFKSVAIENTSLANQEGINCHAADLNDDGFQDIVITHLSGHQILLNNTILDTQSNSPFVDDQFIATGEKSFPIHALVADFNDDGFLDIYSSHFINYTKGQKTEQSEQGFSIQNQVNFKAALFDSQPNKMFFQDPKQPLNFQLADDPVFTSGVGRSLSSYFVDLNFDGKRDIIVTNAFDSRSRVFLAARNSYSEALGDYRLFFADNTPLMIFSKPYVSDKRANMQAYLGRKSGTASQLNFFNTETKLWETVASEVTDRRLSIQTNEWGGAAADLDGNGLSDYFIGAGGIMPMSDSGHFVIGQANRILLQTELNVFVEKSTEQSAFLPQSSRGAGFIDVDNDGSLELITANNNGPFLLQKTSFPAPEFWIGLQLPRSAKFDQALVTLVAGENQLKQQNGFAKNGFLQSDGRLLFVLPKTSAWILQITLSSGESLDFTLTDLNQYYLVTQEGNLEQIAKTQPMSVNYGPLKDLQEIQGLPQDKQLAWLDMQNPSAEVFIPLLDQVWKFLSPETKTALFDRYTINPYWLNLYIIEKSLQYDSDILSQSLIQYLQSIEPEYAERWVLPFIEGLQGEALCRSMDAFKAIFHEEEAMVLSKQLLVAPLIKQFRRANNADKLCILNALGEAENRRITVQLLSSLAQESSKEVKAAIINTLGNIRDSRAKPILDDILETSMESALIAESLIALKRMQSLDLASALQSITIRLDKKKRISVVSYIVTKNDYAVFLAEDRRQLREFFNQATPFELEGTSVVELLMANLVQTANSDLISNYLSSEDTKVRVLAAYMLQSQLKNGKNSSRYSQIIAQELTPESLSLIDKTGLKSGFNLTPPQVNLLLNRWLDNYDDSQFASLFKRLTHLEISTFLLANSEQGIKILKSLNGGQLHWPSIVNGLDKMQSEQKQALLSLWYQDCPSLCQSASDSTTSISQKIRLILNQLYSSVDEPNESQILLLERAAENDWQVVIGILDQKLSKLTEGQVLRVIRKLPWSQLNDHKPFLEKIRAIIRTVNGRASNYESATFDQKWFMFEQQLWAEYISAEE